MENLTDFLARYKSSGVYPFHMPGHKGNSRFIYGGLMGADITEVFGADVLCRPAGVLLSLQKRMARLFGAGESFLLTNGSTCGVLAAVLSVCGNGGVIVAARNAHKSFFAGVELAGAKPVFVMPKITEYGFARAVSPELIEKAVVQHGAKAVFVTSPTYEGVVSDIAEISRIAKKHGAVLIVDEAHGAHFAFSGYFPKTALELGADIVVQSLHKTLPALTQTAVLHTGNGFCSANVKRVINMLQTSSPSYMFMAQADFMTGLLEVDAAEIFAAYVEKLRNFREKANKAENIRLIDTDDLGKLIIHCERCSGAELAEWLRERGGVETELTMDSYIIAMTSCADTSEGFERLLAGLRNIGQSRHALPCWGFHSRPLWGEADRPPGIPAITDGEIIVKE